MGWTKSKIGQIQKNLYEYVIDLWFMVLYDFVPFFNGLQWHCNIHIMNVNKYFLPFTFHHFKELSITSCDNGLVIVTCALIGNFTFRPLQTLWMRVLLTFSNEKYCFLVTFCAAGNFSGNCSQFIRWWTIEAEIKFLRNTFDKMTIIVFHCIIS